MIYRWRSGARTHGAKAQEVGERLEKLRQSHGALTPPLVVAEATDDASPLHPAFEWDDTAAAEKYRLEQARDLLANVVVVLDGPGPDTTRETRAFVVVHQQDESVYQSVEVVLTDPSMRAELLKNALAELKSWQKKYRDLQELAEVFRAAARVSA